MTRPKVILLFGRPGAGKSVISDRYSQMFGLPVIHVGDEIRTMAKENDPVAKRVSTAMKSGMEYEPQDVLFLLNTILLRQPNRFKNGFLIDGFPRWLSAVPLFEAFVRQKGFKIGGAVCFKIPKNQSRSRQLARGRDSSARIKEREKDFEIDELKVIEYYQQKGALKILRAMDFFRQKKRNPTYFIPRQARNLHRIIRPLLRK